MIKILFYFIFLFFQPIFSFAEVSTNQIISDIDQIYLQTSQWQTEFSQLTYVPLLDKNIEKKGIIYLKKPGKIRIEYSTPLQKDYISDGKKLWIYTHGDSVAMKSDQLDEVMSLESFKFLMGESRLERDFHILKKEFSSDQKFLSLTLSPKSSDSIFEKIQIKYFLLDKRIEKLELFNISGNRTEFLFDKTKFNPKLPPDLFKFKKPKGVKIVKG